MAIHEMVEVSQFPVSGVVIPISIFALVSIILGVVSITPILGPVVAVFRMHEGLRVFFYFFANPGMLLQIGLQRRMLLYEFAIVYQRRVLANLFGDLGMTVQEAIETRQFASRGVIISALRGHGTAILRGGVAVSGGLCSYRRSQPEHGC